MGAAMGSPAAAVPAPEAESPQQKQPSADSISVGKGSLVNLMDEETEVHFKPTPSCALMYSKPAAYAFTSLHGICQCLVKHTQQAGCSRLASAPPESLQLCLASSVRLLQCMSAMSGC